MIDTDKYTGHTSDWKWIDINGQDDFYLHSEYGDIINHDTPDGKLAQDAPLLLEQVKRLRELLNMIVDKALHEVNTQPNGRTPYNTILNIAYEGVIE